MRTLKSRIERLETEQRFRSQLAFVRLLDSFSDEQLEDVFIYWRFPDPLPEPVPMGASRFDGLDRKSLLKLWNEEQRGTFRMMREMAGRNEDELRFHVHHGHWPEQPCNVQNCRNQGRRTVHERFTSKV